MSLTLLPSESTLHLQCFARFTVQRNQVVKKSTSAKSQNHLFITKSLCEHIWRKPQVTIFGQSAGSMSCSYHLYSPLSRYLKVSESLYIIGLQFCLWQWFSKTTVWHFWHASFFSFWWLTIDFCNILQEAQSFPNFQGFVPASNSSERRWWIRPLLPSSHCWAGSKVRSLLLFCPLLSDLSPTIALSPLVTMSLTDWSFGALETWLMWLLLMMMAAKYYFLLG